MRAELVLLLVLAAGCGAARILTHPDGNGGWSAERRHEELSVRAAAARVALEPSDAPAADDAPITLDEAVRLATSGNRRIAEADRDVAIARERVWQARSHLLPNVLGSGRYARFTEPQTTGVELTPGLLPAGTAPPEVVVREQAFGVVNAVATVPIDLWGEATKGLTAAQAGYRAEEARRFATTLGEQVAAIRGYFLLLEAEELRGVTEQTLAAQRQQLANAAERVAAGRLTRNELLVVQVSVQNTEQLLRQRELEVARARWTLNQVIDRAVDAPTRVLGVRERPVVPSAADAVRAAYAHNPVLATLVEEQQRLEDTASALARGRLPRVAGGGTIDYSSAEVVQPQLVGSGFVGFVWDLSTDGRREAEIAAARIAADQNRVRIERTLRELEAAVRTTQRAAEERLAALATAETAVGQAEENLRIRQQQFDVGRATSEDVLDAEALLTEQRATLATALYQAHTRRAELQQVIGLPVDTILPTQR